MRHSACETCAGLQPALSAFTRVVEAPWSASAMRERPLPDYGADAPPSGLHLLHAGARAPHIDAGEQEQPHHVDEVPVPGRELEAEMLVGLEVARVGPDQAH